MRTLIYAAQGPTQGPNKRRRAGRGDGTRREEGKKLRNQMPGALVGEGLQLIVSLFRKGGHPVNHLFSLKIKRSTA